MRRVDWKTLHAFNLDVPGSGKVQFVEMKACCNDISVHQHISMCHYHSITLAESSILKGSHWTSVQC